jgi:hypothetical protein
VIAQGLSLFSISFDALNVVSCITLLHIYWHYIPRLLSWWVVWQM